MQLTVKKVLLGSMVMSVIIAGCGMAYLQRAQSSLAAQNGRDAQRSLDAAIDTAGVPVKNFVTDYSYWDDLVAFVRNGSTVWADKNLAAVMPEAKTDAIWVFNTGFSPVYETARVQSLSAQKPLAAHVVQQAFAGKRITRFFVKIPDGVLEVHGATIHPTADSARATEPQGYLLAGRVWTKEYIAALEGKTNSRITLAAIAGSSTGIEDGMIRVAAPLDGGNGKPAVLAVMRLPSPLAASLSRQRIAAAAATAIPLALLCGTILFMVLRPLSSLMARVQMKDIPVSRLGSGNSEFDLIARHMAATLEAKNALEAERTALNERITALTADKENLTEQVQRSTDEVAALKKSIAERKPDPELESLRKTRTELENRLHVVNELLQREILSEHEHHKNEMMALYEKEHLEHELSAVRDELVRRSDELMALQALSAIETPKAPARFNAAFHEANC